MIPVLLDNEGDARTRKFSPGSIREQRMGPKKDDSISTLPSPKVKTNPASPKEVFRFVSRQAGIRYAFKNIDMSTHGFLAST